MMLVKKLIYLFLLILQIESKKYQNRIQYPSVQNVDQNLKVAVEQKQRHKSILCIISSGSGCVRRSTKAPTVATDKPLNSTATFSVYYSTSSSKSEQSSMLSASHAPSTLLSTTTKSSAKTLSSSLSQSTSTVPPKTLSSSLSSLSASTSKHAASTLSSSTTTSSAKPLSSTSSTTKLTSSSLLSLSASTSKHAASTLSSSTTTSSAKPLSSTSSTTKLTAISGRTCGKQAIPPNVDVPRIVGGNTAKPNSWPWTVYVRIDWDPVHPGGFGNCDGTLIESNEHGKNSDILVTAAHCLFDPYGVTEFGHDKVTIYLGLHDKRLLDDATVVTASVRAIRRHKDFDRGTLVNDIALIQLDEPVTFTDYIQPVCLPDVNQQPSDKQACYAVGWGRTSEDATSLPKELQEVKLPILPDNNCPYKSFKTALMLCAGYLEGGKDTCLGDSGGALSCKETYGWTQYGITSFGEGCARVNKPGVYTNVRYYANWIKDTVKEFGRENLEHLEDDSF